MTTRASLVEKYFAVWAVIAISCFVSCNPSQQSQESGRSAAPVAATPAEKVLVTFEGPWAFVADPKDPNIILALAPKTKAHHDLRVGASNLVSLASGTYELSVPAHGAPAAAGFDASFAQAKIDAKSLQSALEDKTGRYVIRLPKPEAYLAVSRVKIRVGASYPPDATTEQSYITSVSLRYTVSNMTGFSLSGNPDSGTFNPLLLQVETPMIQFVIEPVGYDPLDKCNTHARQAFHDLVKLLNLKLYMDFPGEPPSCQKSDPQNARAAMDAVMVTSGKMATIVMPSLLEIVPARAIESMAAYFLAIHVTDCRVPMLFLTVSP